MERTAPARHSHATNRPRRRRDIVGPYSRLIDRGALGAINGSSREGRFLRDYEKRLLEHIGGRPSIVQRALITRAARLALHLELLDQRALVDGRGLSESDCHYYTSWANALARHLDKLGITGAAAEPQPSHFDAIMREVEGDVA